jgi:O-antigen ligase
MVSNIVLSNQLTRGRWFPLVELGCVGLATILWEIGSLSAYLPFLIALVPWVVRFAVGSSPFKGWGIDLALALFIATAATAAWLACDELAAIYKFWLLVAAVLLFYAVANQPENNLWISASLISLLGVGIALYYLLTNDWGIYPSRIEILNQTGVGWMAIRPTIQSEMIHPNTVAGIIGMALPFLLASSLYALRNRKWFKLAGIGLGLLVMLLVLLMTTSRGVWIAISVASLIAVVWMISTFLARFLRWRREGVFVLILILGVVIVGGLAVGYTNLFPNRGAILTDNGQTTTRQEMTQGAISLIGDFPFTGAGLETFPGLFSTYFLITPNYIIPHSYNIYLDMALEQGIVALLAFVWVLAVSTILLLFFGKSLPSHLSLLRWAILASLLIVVIHSFFDDIVYDFRAAPLLFLIPGIAMALAEPSLVDAVEDRRPRFNRWVLIGTALTSLAFLLVGYIANRPVMASWYANLGALQMARFDLADWNTGTWKDGSQIEGLKPAEELFIRALEYDPGNQTANHRLGLINMISRDFPAAVAHLTLAYQKEPSHRGIVKALGLSYVWNKQPDQALPLLKRIPEAEAELAIYPWWWRNQGREDLAQNAELLLARLAPAETQ